MRTRVATVVVAAALVGVAGASAAAVPAYTHMLARPGEVPGYTIGKPYAQTTVSAAVIVSGTPMKERAALRKHYFAEGYVASAVERLKGANKRIGVSTVFEFKTAAGAKQEQAFALAQIGKRRFAAPGVPGAKGAWAANGSASAANVVWTEGRCTMIVGDYIPNATAPVTAPLLAAAKAIFARTHTICR